MIVLALDTTTRVGSVAVARDGTVEGVLVGDPTRPHAERVPANILRLLDRAGIRLPQVDVFAVAIGPGSFTGLRIGIAAIQGCAFAAGRPVVGMSALEALAHAAPGGRLPGPLPRVGVWMDAQRSEVFSALYERDEAASPVQLRALEEPCVGGPDEIAVRWRTLGDARWFPVVGDGALKYRQNLDATAGFPVEVISPPALAPIIAVLAWHRALAGEATAPHAIRPLYLRRPDAELARDRRLRER